MRRRILIVSVLLALFAGLWAIGYDKRPLPEIKPEECPAFQESQGVIIGAMPYVGPDRIKQIFDIKELYQDGIVPVLLVVRNTNKFGITLGGRGFSLVDRNGGQNRPEPWDGVASAILQRTQKSRTVGIPAIDLIKGASGRGADVIGDLRAKALDVSILKGGESTRGVLYFRLGTDPKVLEGSRICVQEIYNNDSAEELLFIEFDLKLPPETKPPVKK